MDKDIRDFFIKKIGEKYLVYYIFEMAKRMELYDYKNRLVKKYRGNWGYITEHEYLSEEFIREFQEDVIWWKVSMFQEISDSFIGEFEDKFILG